MCDYHLPMTKGTKFLIAQTLKRSNRERIASREQEQLQRIQTDQLKRNYSFLRTVSQKKLWTVISAIGISGTQEIADKNRSAYLFLKAATEILNKNSRNAVA